ncbi:hypothetical protein SEPCBS119000_006766, partial [Sporothrix epigloea]
MDKVFEDLNSSLEALKAAQADLMAALSNAFKGAVTEANRSLAADLKQSAIEANCSRAADLKAAFVEEMKPQAQLEATTALIAETSGRDDSMVVNTSTAKKSSKRDTQATHIQISQCQPQVVLLATPKSFLRASTPYKDGPQAWDTLPSEFGHDEWFYCLENRPLSPIRKTAKNYTITVYAGGNSADNTVDLAEKPVIIDLTDEDPSSVPIRTQLYQQWDESTRRPVQFESRKLEPIDTAQPLPTPDVTPSVPVALDNVTDADLSDIYAALQGKAISSRVSHDFIRRHFGLVDHRLYVKTDLQQVLPVLTGLEMRDRVMEIHREQGHCAP